MKNSPFVLAGLSRGRQVITAASHLANEKGIITGMQLADARALCPGLTVLDDEPALPAKLLTALATWCIRYTPVAAVDHPDGLVLDISGCAHLWGGEREYLKDLVTRLRAAGYHARGAIADTVGTAWAVARFGRTTPIIPVGGNSEALLELPPAALRLEPAITEKMDKLGLYQIRNFLHLPRNALRRRFGQSLLFRIDQALGYEHEPVQGVCPVEPYQERLPCLEPIRTRTGIEIALEKLLIQLCQRLEQEVKGLRTCVLKTYRVDGVMQQIEIATSRASRNMRHLFKLFEIKIPQLAPALGFELFILEAPVVETLDAGQETLWNLAGSNNSAAIAELIDRLMIKVGAQAISRYLPDEHHWPERSIKKAVSLQEQPATTWPTDLFRPIHLLQVPAQIDVTVPLPDYPPMNFRYKGHLHKVCKADGPERIEQEWWMDSSKHRDYYAVEDEQGHRYWLFRLGSYDDDQPHWFVHGFFA